MRGILHDTFLEMLDRKVLYIYIIVTVITIGLILVGGSIDINEPAGMGGGNVDLNEVNNMLGNPVLRGYAGYVSFLIFMTVLATAGAFPSMLMRGRSDYFISKPISRPSLYLYKLFSILIVYGAVVIFLSLICYLVFYLMFGIFVPSILFLYLFSLFQLLIWLSITSFVGIFIGSTGATLMVTFGVWVIQYILSFHESITTFANKKVITTLVETAYYIFPKTGEVSDITIAQALGGRIESYLPFWSTALFAVALIAITAYLFQKKNY